MLETVLSNSKIGCMFTFSIKDGSNMTLVSCGQTESEFVQIRTLQYLCLFSQKRRMYRPGCKLTSNRHTNHKLRTHQKLQFSFISTKSFSVRLRSRLIKNNHKFFTETFASHAEFMCYHFLLTLLSSQSHQKVTMCLYNAKLILQSQKIVGIGSLITVLTTLGLCSILDTHILYYLKGWQCKDGLQLVNCTNLHVTTVELFTEAPCKLTLPLSANWLIEASPMKLVDFGCYSKCCFDRFLREETGVDRCA